tara:strand:- start:4124 stop:5086 length:963 start_codon:yes stop_codon:yes gene_type:complete
MFYSIDRLSSNTESDFLSTATMQAHVRAVDATENSLLEIYRNAAIDYLQNLSDRVIGISDVVVTLSFNEMLDPVRLQKIQDITSIKYIKYRSTKTGNLEYYTPELSDDAEHGHYVTSLAFADASGAVTPVNRVMEVDAATTTIDVTMTGALDSGATMVNADFRLYRYNFFSKEYTYVAADDSSGGGVSYTGTFADLSVGVYRIDFTPTESDGHTHTSSRYFAISNGTLFNGVMNTANYPSILNVCNLRGLLTDADSTDEKGIQIGLAAGTAYNGLPKQYYQAALLLVGHYYNMREAENIGGITSEVKEGVKRLVASVRQY